AFPGHIACSPLSRSELVLPVRDAHGVVRAVFDIDSSAAADFDVTDVERLQGLLGAHAPRLIPEADA
ncbi:MAG: hypothetical protein ACPG85_01750, partial [Flavobacteriales bacterium]